VPAVAAVAVASQPAQQAAATHAEGWYPDYADATRLRWYDGNAWTEHVHPAVPVQPAYGANPYAAATPYSQAAAVQQMPSNGCMQCGATPAAQVTFHGHRGMLILQRFLTYRGQWCRDCGVAKFREVQHDTMLLGWWGFISFFVTGFNLIQNTLELGKVTKLGTPSGRLRAALPPRGTVFLTPGFGVMALLVAYLAYRIVS